MNNQNNSLKRPHLKRPEWLFKDFSNPQASPIRAHVSMAGHSSSLNKYGLGVHKTRDRNTKVDKLDFGFFVDPIVPENFCCVLLRTLVCHVLPFRYRPSKGVYNRLTVPTESRTYIWAIRNECQRARYGCGSKMGTPNSLPWYMEPTTKTGRSNSWLNFTLTHLR